jgi:nitrogenase molybdenum-iron protein alpha/beta subunit
MRTIRHRQLERMAGTVDKHREVCSYSGVLGRVSGNIMALRGIEDVVVLLHAPSGCAYHNRLVPRLHAPYYELRGSDMTERDIVFGCAERLESSIERIIREEAPAMIAVVPSAVSQMVSSDVREVVERFNGDPRCKVVGVRPRCFSHRNRRVYRDAAGEVIERDSGIDPFGASEPSGCGSNEAVCSLVEQVMEPTQRVEHDLLNAWVTPANNTGSGFCDTGEDLPRFAATLAEVGLRLNTLDSVEHLRKASAACYNLAGHCRWTKMMEKAFGTEFFGRDDGGDDDEGEFIRSLCTIDGIRALFLMIADVCGKRDDMQAVLDREYEGLRARHEAVKEAYGRYRYAAFSWNWNVKGVLTTYRQDFGIVPAYYIINLNEDFLRRNGATEEDVLKERESFRREMDEIGFEGTVVYAQDRHAVQTALKDVDILINGTYLLNQYPNDPIVRQARIVDSPIAYRPFSITGKVESMEASLFAIRNASPNTFGLAQRLQRHREQRPAIEKGREQALNWWRRMWFNDRQGI